MAYSATTHPERKGILGIPGIAGLREPVAAGARRRKRPYLRPNGRGTPWRRHRRSPNRYGWQSGQLQNGIQVANDFLNPERALIFRITHRNNVRWLFENGVHCRHSPNQDPNFVNIGNADLIGKRDNHPVKHAMAGTLGDYVPFYFTPFSPMLYNIKTGRGVPKRPMEEIVILATSLHALRKRDIPFIFTDRHAYLTAAQPSSDLARLDWIDWQMLRDRDFVRDPEHPERFDKYQAEALVHRHLPANALLGVFCYTKVVEARIAAHAEECGLDLKVACRPHWYV